ncbi:CD209 antigen-like protein A isoform X4 [Callospermophilus lateralis]|uniref:CD209 antigen-like protein A isoform X4 n=1 Tax=Callospermophilus lateralis TaxID=76772 RepID=UPI004054125F
MSDFKHVRVQQLDPLEEELAASSTRGSLSHHALQPPSRVSSSAGCLGSSSALLVLQLLSLMVLTGLLVAVLAQVSRVPSSQAQEQELSKQKVCQELTQLKAGVDRLCRPCPWDWTFFQGHCYFFSKSQRNWHDSVTACQEVGAQLVIIKSAEEQSFLEQLSKKSQRTWIGLSDHNNEGSWYWVDNTPLQLSYWKEGEPNNAGDEDCVELSVEDWNDSKCTAQNFWICERPSARCPGA